MSAPYGSGPDAQPPVAVGETIRRLPVEEHWDGATPEAGMAHIAIVVAPIDRDGTVWLEPVDDAYYRASAAGGGQ